MTGRWLGGWPFAWMTEPGRFQVVFTVAYALDVAVRAGFGQPFDPSSGPGAGAFAAVAMLIVALTVPWARLGPRVSLVVPVADIAIIGITRLSEQGGNGLLVVFPALWLGRQFGRTGAVVTGVASVLFIVVPGVVYSGGDPVLLARNVFIPVVAVVTALAIADGMDQVRVEQVHAEGQRDQLAAALTTIERQRRISQAIFDAVDVGLLLLDSEGRYAGGNRRHQEFMRLAFPDGHRGRAGQLGAVFDVDGRTPLTREQMPSYRASTGEEFDDLRMWVGADPGTRRAVSVSARAVLADDGSFSGAALGYTDVTDFMRALRVKDEFVALVSHELRTPLTSIVGYVQLLEEDPTMPPHAVQQLRVVHRNGDRLRRLIADLLDTAQRDGGPMPVSRSRGDLAAIVVEAVEAARPTADRSGIHLELTAPEGLPMLLDAQRVAQVVDNLVSNALKYTERGGRVSVVLSATDEQVVLDVVDSGIGISPEDCARLFTRFFRTDDAARRAVAGAGLGLSITKDIVESHGGRIEVHSEVGRGSRFRVVLPR